MSWRKFALAVVVVFLVYSAVGFLVHEQLLKQDYQGIASILRPVEQFNIWLVMLSNLLFALGFTFIYVKGIEQKPWLGQGVRFGFAVAILTVVAENLIDYTVHPIPQSLMWKSTLYESLGMMITGVVAAATYRV
jgi:hypothetical protein